MGEREESTTLHYYLAGTLLPVAENTAPLGTPEPCQVIVRPLKILRRNSRVARRILSCWVGALVFAAPQLLIFREAAVADQSRGGGGNGSAIRLECTSSGYTASWQRKLYMLYVPLVVVAMPTVVMVRCYGRIVLIIWRRTRLAGTAGQRGSGSSSSDVLAHQCRLLREPDCGPRSSSGATPPAIRLSATAATAHHLPSCNSASGGGGLLSTAKIKAVFMSLTVVTAFLVCWVPYFLALLILVFSDFTLLNDSLFVEVSKHLVLLHSVLNPIIYFIFARRFTAMARLCSSCSGCCRFGTDVLVVYRSSPITHGGSAACDVIVVGLGNNSNELS